MLRTKIEDYSDPVDDRYERLLKEYQEFSYVVSHDLHAPLRQVSGFTTLLLEDLNLVLSDQQQVYKDMVFRAIKEAEHSLDALLEFSRLNTDEKVFQDINTRLLLKETLKNLQFRIEESGANIEIGDMPKKIRGDKKTLVKALFCLLDNSIKFQPADQKPEIQIKAKQDHDKTVFCIEDNGIGIKQEQQERIFTILRKLHSTDVYSGRGAGLALAKKIAQIHGGEIYLHSRPHQGTKVFFSIALDIK